MCVPLSLSATPCVTTRAPRQVAEFVERAGFLVIAHRGDQARPRGAGGRGAINLARPIFLFL